MSTALVVLDQDDLTLDELGVRVRDGHRAVLAHVADAFGEALQTGEFLLRAKELVPAGEWAAWCRSYDVPEGSEGQYRRLAFYRKEIFDASPDGEVLNYQRAMLYIRGLPAIGRPLGSPNGRADLDMRAEVRRLHAQGLSLRKTAKQLGIGENTVKYHLYPEQERKARNQRKWAKRKLASAAASRQLSEETAKRRGGTISEAYSLIRKAALQLQGALEDAVSNDERVAYNVALTSLYAAEDALGRALRVALPRDPRGPRA